MKNPKYIPNDLQEELAKGRLKNSVKVSVLKLLVSEYETESKRGNNPNYEDLVKKALKNNKITMDNLDISDSKQMSQLFELEKENKILQEYTKPILSDSETLLVIVEYIKKNPSAKIGDVMKHLKTLPEDVDMKVASKVAKELL